MSSITGPSDWPSRTLLGRIPAAARAELLTLGTFVRFRPGAALLSEGEPSTHVLLLVQGCVKILASVENGSQALLALRLAGDLVGEMAMLEDKPRSATVVACVPTAAQVIRGTRLKTFLTSHADVSFEVNRMVSERLRWSNRRRVDFASWPPAVRVARVLVELAERYGEPGRASVALPLTQSEIASIAGVAQRSVENALRSFDDEGAVERSYRRVVVHDDARLRELAQF